MTYTMTVTPTPPDTAHLRRLRHALTGALVMLLGSTMPAAADQHDYEESTSIEAVLVQYGVESGHLEASVISAWNQRAHDIAFEEDQFLTFKGQRALAMMHLAMHDALNSIAPVYQRYAYAGARLVAHPIAATAQAAHDVLISQYPDQQPKLAAELAVWLGQAPIGALRDRGIELGRATAATILKLRIDDGWNFPGTYRFRSRPGQYQTTPPWDGFVAQPGFRFARPFVLAFQSQFRPSPPPPVTSATYARAFQEIKQYGAINSTHRTEEQTAYAVWWMEFAEGSVNRLARQLVTDRGTHLWASARMFAHMATALFDGYVAVWDSKYEYNHWRPYTAIRAADTDDNPDTTPDPGWAPLRPTPPFPEYASVHATACAASFGVLERAFGGHVSFTMETTTAPPDMPTRAFANFRAAALECADSRVRLGWHFRYATDAGLALGRHIASRTVTHSLRKLRQRHDDR